MIYDRADSTTISTVIGICVGVWCLYEYFAPGWRGVAAWSLGPLLLPLPT